MTSAIDISVVIPAWNEEQYLPRLLDTLDAARARYRGEPDAVEVIVADNGSTDATARIARERGCRVAPVAKRCIAASRNGGAAIARGEILAFVDADYRIHAETLNYIAALMARGDYVGGGTGTTSERWSAGIVATWALLMAALMPLGLDGGVWFCRREDFTRVGGYDERVRCSEDVRLLLALKRLGRSCRPRQRLATRFAARRSRLAPAIAVASSRKFDKLGDWHMITGTLQAAFWMIFGRKKVAKFIQWYWYEENGGR